jgi:hypothetical protein
VNPAPDRPALLKFEEVLLPVLAATASEHRSNEATEYRRASPPRRTLLSVAVLGILLALVVPLMLPEGPGGASPAAADALHRVALRAAQLPAEPSPGPGEYLYAESSASATNLYVTGSDVPNFFFETTTKRSTWISPDGSGRIIEVSTIDFPSEDDRSAWREAGAPRLQEDFSSDEMFGRGELGYVETSELPSDPTELRSWIELRTGDDAWRTFSMVGDLLRYRTAPPAVRAALYLVAADLDGVELVGEATDALGRSGVAVAYTHAGLRHELIFDPGTAELLGEEDVLLEDSEVDVESGGPGAIYGLVGPAGTRASATTYLFSEITDAIFVSPERPA